VHYNFSQLQVIQNTHIYTLQCRRITGHICLGRGMSSVFEGSKDSRKEGDFSSIIFSISSHGVRSVLDASLGHNTGT